MYGKAQRLPIASAVALAAALCLIFFYAPIEADQGFVQKIFYLHVPLAIVTLCGFLAGSVMAIAYLRTGNRTWDMRSYVAIHLSLVFAVGVLLTGSIWAKASWGHWWVWSEPVLVSFLIIFLLYCCYQPLRFAIEGPERQAQYAAVFAVVAGAFIPINFIAVRLASAYTHPRVFTDTGRQMPASMETTFIVALIAIALLWATLWRLELVAKALSFRVRSVSREADVDTDLDPASSPRAAVSPPENVLLPTTTARSV